MKKQELMTDDVNALIHRIELNPKLNALFVKLFALYGLPKWLTEKKPFQDPEILIEEWEKLVADYDDLDIMEASNKLFKFNKLKSFPTAAHIKAELPDDAKMIKHEAKKAAYFKPSELIPFWDKAITFAAVLNMFRNPDKTKDAEADDIRKRMSVTCLLWAQQRTYRAMRKYLSNEPRIDDLYENPVEKFVYCFKAGVFDKIREKIKQNLSGQFEPQDITEEA